MRDERQKMLASEGIGKLLWKLSLPAGIGMFVMALYNVVDTVFIGRTVGVIGIAGLSIAFPVQMLIMGIGMMVGIGGASLISRSLGARDFQKAELTLGNAIFFTIVLAVSISVIGLSNIDFWVRLFGASATILPYTRDYLSIILMGAVAPMFAISAGSLVRSEGNARVPMMSMLIGAMLNILLDAIFILVLGMGIKGAAIATVISQVTSSLYLISYYQLQNSSLKLHLNNLTPDRNIAREIFSIGLASLARSTTGSFVIILLNRTLGTYGGDSAIAIFGMINRIMRFAIMPLISTGQGLQPILGFNYGAKQFNRALKVTRLATVVTTIAAFTMFLVLFFLPTPILSIFTTDTSLVAEASQAAKTIFLAFYLVGFQIVASVFFQAIGKAVPAFIAAISRQVLCLLPLILILPRFFELDGVWLSFPIADGLSFALIFAIFTFQKRNLQHLAISGENEEHPFGAEYPDKIQVESIPDKIKPEEHNDAS